MLTSDKITNLNWSLHNFKIEERNSLNKAIFELHQHSVYHSKYTNRWT